VTRRLIMMLVAAVVVVVGVGGVGVAQAPAASTKKTCRWVKATKKTKRHKVCTVKRKRTTAAPVLGSPAPAPVAPHPAPAAAATPAAPGTDTSPFAEPAPGSGAAPAPATPPARLQVTAREWSLMPSRTEVPAGSLIAELVNRGEDGHDLHLRPAAGGPDVLALAETASRDVSTSAPTAIAPGAYTLYCSLPGHEQKGMSVALTVR
jgi:plastocyanin